MNEIEETMEENASIYVEEKDKRENLIMITIWTLYEYLSVTSGIILDNRGLAKREMELGIEGRRERFDIMMNEFLRLANHIGLDAGDKSTFDLIWCSYDEHGVSEMLFDDTKLALMTNTRIIKELKGMGLGCMLFGEKIVIGSCGSEI